MYTKLLWLHCGFKPNDKAKPSNVEDKICKTFCKKWQSKALKQQMLNNSNLSSLCPNMCRSAFRGCGKKDACVSRENFVPISANDSGVLNKCGS